MVYIISYIFFRNYLLKQRLSKGPNKIVLCATDFVFPIEGRRVSKIKILHLIYV